MIEKMDKSIDQLMTMMESLNEEDGDDIWVNVMRRRDENMVNVVVSDSIDGRDVWLKVTIDYVKELGENGIEEVEKDSN